MGLKLSIRDACEVLKIGLQAEGIDVLKVNLLNNMVLRIELFAKHTKSIDVKSEVAFVMSFAHGFLKDGNSNTLQFGIEYIAVELSKTSGGKLMHAISPVEAVEYIASGQPIQWLNKSTFQDHTEDFIQGLAKRNVSDLENGMRRLIVKVLSNSHGTNWWNAAVGNGVRQSTQKRYEAQEGITISDGEKLICFTFLLELRKIIVSNWLEFESIFKNQARFTQLLDDLNNIRRAEAHNREISEFQLNELKSIHEELLGQIASYAPEAVANYLVENWRIQLRKIFEANIEKYQLPTPRADDIQSAISSVEAQIHRYDDLEVRIQSVVVPPFGKENLNNELIACIVKVKKTLAEMVDAVKQGRFDDVESLKLKNDKANEELQSFREKYLMSEL